MAVPVPSLLDPPSESALAAAFIWVEATLTGTLATIVATIAVAGLGLLLLSGRVDARRGLTVLVGCFVLFGANSIARGLRDVADGDASVLVDVPPPVPPILPLPPQLPNTGYDPYAGASVPQ
jgi:type IV secretion system protein VirB2